MTPLAKITLLYVVFVDLLGQGLVFPILNTLIMEPKAGFLPASVSTAARHLDYGLVIGAFFIAWFLGVVYVAKLSDSIGRKNALLICLFGALAGYVLTIAALYVSNIWLLIAGRAVTGFTAGNQPIAQAAMIDGSTDAADRDRNVGYTVTGVSFGLVGGPIIGAILSTPEVLGDWATLKTPFYGALALVALAIFMVIAFFEDRRSERAPFVFRPFDVITSLWAITRHPLVRDLMPVYAFFMIANVTFYVFVDNYLTSAFGYGVVGSSAVFLVVGAALAISSTFLVAPVQARFSKRAIVRASLVVMLVSPLAFILITWGPATYAPVFAFYFLFGVSYPTLLGLFSGSVGPNDQGWVMGVTTAVFCLFGGIMSLLGGDLMTVNIRLPFYIVAAAALLGLLAMPLTWRGDRMRRLVGAAAPS